MKKFRLSLIYIAVAALLGAYIYFFERGPVKPKDEEKNKIFNSFVADDIRKIRVEHFGATLTAMKVPIDMEKDSLGVWQITAPRKFKADENTLRTLLTTAGDFNPENVIENPADLVEYGLNSPTARCTFINQAGVSFVLTVGNKNVTDSNFYIKTADKKTVYLLTASGIGLMTKGLDDYRDHTFLKTDLVLAQKIELKYEGRNFAFEKGKDNNWNITRPIKTQADATKLRDLLTNVSNLRIEEFVDEQPSDLSIYGFDDPRCELKVWPSEGKAARGFIIGNKITKKDFCFAKPLDSLTVSRVRDFNAKMFDIKLNDYRDKTFLKFDAGQAKTLTLQHAGKKVVYQKASNGQWVSEGRLQANPEAVGVISDLSNALIQEFPEQGEGAGLQKPNYTAEAILNDGTSRTYHFGNLKNDQVFVGFGKETEAYLVTAQVLSQITSVFTPPTPTIAAATTPVK
jgi:hypothetical protein